MDLVLIDTLRTELGMQFRELNAILLDFERKKGWVTAGRKACRFSFGDKLVTSFLSIL